VKIRPAGDRALLVELGDVPAAELHGAAAAARACEGVIACIAGHSSLLVVYTSRPDPAQIERALERAPGKIAAPRRHRLEVSFGDEYGLDLAEFLARTRMDRDQFLRRIAELRLVVRFIGFRGGFGYLDGWPAEWSMPRRETSRARVARGSFAIAGAVAGFYPIDSPGGWNVLGRTAAALEHALAPGDEIEIEPTVDLLPPAAGEAGARMSKTPPASPLRMVHGVLARIVGPPDWSNVEKGVPAGGPFDREAAEWANRAAGNPLHAPVLECALVGPRLVAEENLVLSWFGAEAEIRCDGEIVDQPAQFVVKKGMEVNVGRLSGGARGYLAAGPRRGEVRPLERDDRFVIRCAAGPHQSALREMSCEVTPQLDRVGVRLRLVFPLLKGSPADLPSCGMTFGTVQLHPDGSAVVMGPDHPVTGGYLQPMTVMSTELWKIAQLGPGDRIRFVAQSLAPYT
jgi:KipI family sensor histidine kinase inhibitor